MSMHGGGPPPGSPRMMGGPMFFGDVPEHAKAKLAEFARTEPAHDEPPPPFSQTTREHGFTLFRFLSPHRWAMTGALLLVAAETLTMQAGPMLTQIGIDRGIVAGNRGALAAAVIAYALAVVFGSGATTARIAVTGRLGERLMLGLRIRVFMHLQRLSMPFFTNEMAGRIMTRMTSDIESLTALFQEGLVNLAVQALTVVVITIALFVLNVQLATITVLIVLPVMLALTLWFRSASDRGYDAVRERIADVMADLQESVAGVRIVTAHNRQIHNVLRHRRIVGTYRDANLYTGKIGAIYGPGAEVVGIAATGMLLLVGGRMVLDGSLLIGELTAFILYLTMFFAPIQQLVQLYSVYQQGRAAIKKISGLLDEVPSVPESPEAVDLPPVQGEILLQGVTFGYDSERPVLRDIDLHIPAGETVALVGPTGAGKSTVVKLVARFYDPDAGRVTVDGHDVRDVTLRSLRSQIGNVPQEPFLFAGSIRDNVAYARPDATDDEVLEACRQVGLGDLVERLPDGLDTPCHERGVSLSAGERQLLALARAFLARPRVLILDEATSSLDLATEAKVERALGLLLEGRTAMVIAHRLSTAMRADRIGVIEDGRLVELGPHDELIARGGRYAAMFETWMSHAEGARA